MLRQIAIEWAPIGSRWRHKKRGTLYNVIGYATIQTSIDILLDGAVAVVYEAESDNSWNVRSADEFLDGRFERVQLP